MIGFLRLCFQCFLRKEEFLNRFFYLEFDPAILEERKAHRGQSERDRREPSTSGLKDPLEESSNEMTLDLKNRRYNFYPRPTGGRSVV